MGIRLILVSFHFHSFLFHFFFFGDFSNLQAEELSKLVIAAREEVTSGIGRRAKLRSAASAAVRVLELKDKDIRPGLSTLLNQVL